MAFLSDPELKVLVTNVLQRMNLEGGTFWNQIIPEANEAAQNEITAKFRGDGYTDAEASGWYRAKEFNVCLGLWWSITMGGVSHNYDQTYLKELDRREELRDMELILEEPDPDDETVIGGVRSGDLKNDGDIFSMGMKL